MTAIDLLVIALCLWLGRAVWRSSLARSYARRSALAVLAGAMVVGLFYLADLLTMFVAPSLLGREQAATLMQALHLEVSWLVTLGSLGFIVAGFCGLLGHVEDANSALLRQIERLGSLIEQLPLPTALLSTDGRVTRVNALGLHFVGVREAPAIEGRCFWELPKLSARYRERVEAGVARAVSGETVHVELEDYRVGADQEPAVFDLSLSPIRNPSGAITEIVATATDISTAWYAAVASAKSEERFRSLLTHTQDRVYCMEFDPPIPTDLPLAEQMRRIRAGVLVECNKQFALGHGAQEPEHIIGKTMEELTASVGARSDELLERFVLDGYRMNGFEIETQRPKGERRYFANSGYGVIEDGQLIRRWGSFHDITERVLAVQELQNALRQIEELKSQLEEENYQLRAEVRLAHGFPDIIGEDPKLTHCLELVRKVAPTDAAVLILGETGTGKELVARAIHHRSRRSEQALIRVNCAALPAELIESELFGHEKGAFTGAHSRRLGRFELADGGTLFLDEIGDLPFELQGKLLRVLQEGEFERLGGTDTLRVDVRIIAATNKDLRAEVDASGFRADLFYRISTFPIMLPALRERRNDIPILVQHFVQKHEQRLGRSIESVSARMLRHLRRQRWPGNVRELEAFVERALISAQGPVLDHIEEESLIVRSATLERVPAGQDLRDVERRHIEATLSQTEWVIEGGHGAAARLGMAPSTLRSKMKRLRIRRPEARA